MKSSETAYFWYRTTLDAAPSIEEGSSGLKWWIVLCLLLSWIVVFFIVMKGIQSSGKVRRMKNKSFSSVLFFFLRRGEGSSLCSLVRAKKLPKLNNIDIVYQRILLFLLDLKVVYFTSMFPYLVLTIFFIRGITLKGASAGLAHMYTPKVNSLFPRDFLRLTVKKKKCSLSYRQIEKLLEPTVWLDAATQVFYSFGLAFGSLIAFGSYNTPDNHCVRDVILVSCCNAFTAIYASVVIFAILGFKAMTNVDKCLAG